MGTFRQRVSALSLALLVAAQAQAAKQPILPEEPVRFAYSLPRTALKLSGTATLRGCNPDPLVDLSLTVSSTGEADPAATFYLDTKSLGSATQKRDIKLELTDAGTLKSINATSSDRTGAIISNVLKTIASIATIALIAKVKSEDGSGTPSDGPICNEQTMAALRQVDDLKVAIDDQRDAMGQADDHSNAKAVGEAIDALAARLASLTLNELTINLSTTLPVGDGPKGDTEVSWTLGDFSKWLSVDPTSDPCTPVSEGSFSRAARGANGCTRKTSLLRFAYSIAAAAPDTAARPSNSPCLSLKPSTGETERATEQRLKTCGKTLVLIEPPLATVTVKIVDDKVVGHITGDTLTTVSTPISQWARVIYLPIDVKFMQSRTIGMTFDQFGRKQTFSWTSEATAENATSALADIAKNGTDAINAIAPGKVAELNKENDLLTAQQKNVTLKACQTAMDAGATSCPSQ